MIIKIDKQIKTPVYLQISNQVKEKILTGELADGTSLPSERVMAHILGVHRNTVVRAYNELKAEELIDSRQGVGYIITLAKEEGHKEAELKAKGKKVNWLHQIKGEYLDLEVTFDDLYQRFGEIEKYSLGSGIASSEIYDRYNVAADISSIIAGDGKAQYFFSPYKGDKVLRQKLVSFMSTKGVKVSTGQIQILKETNQAIDFIATLLLDKGDRVIIEEPVSPDVYRALELAGAKIVTIPLDEDGMQCDMLEELAEKYKPRFIYVNSSFHDPTGIILPMERRKKILEVSQKYRIPIVEEDAASELYYGDQKLPPIKALDDTGNVIYIYSFALTFMPGLNLAFVAADSEVIKRLSYLVPVRMISIDWVAQKLLAKYLHDGAQYIAFEAFRKNYGAKQKLVCDALENMKDLGVDFVKPRGGVYIWCKLPEGLDSKEFINAAYHKGLTLIPGHIFYPFKNGGRDHVRINYSFETEEGIVAGMDIFRSTVEELLALKK